MCLVKLLAVLILGGVGISDPDIQKCDILEHNICVDHRTGKERIDQIVAWDRVEDRLFSCGWCYSSNVRSVCKINGGYLVIFESGHIVKTPVLYNSLTANDVEIDGRPNEKDKTFKYFHRNIFLNQ